MSTKNSGACSMNPLAVRLLDLLYPPKCVFCGGLLEEGEKGLCAVCQRALPWAAEDAPPKRVEYVERCAAPLWYRDVVRESFHRYKFEGRDLYAPVYGKLMAQCVRDRLGLGFDAVTWAPLSKKRKRKRGDQAELLARVLASELDKPAVSVLRKVRDTVEQSSLDDEAARAQNAAGAYECADPAAVMHKRVLLVDDIVTTGSTLSQCAQILLDAGAKEIWAATFARAHR